MTLRDSIDNFSGRHTFATIVVAAAAAVIVASEERIDLARIDEPARTVVDGSSDVHACPRVDTLGAHQRQ